MRLFVTTDFEGHYPVGTAALMVAEDEEMARAMLNLALEPTGLRLKPTDMVMEISLHSAFAMVLRDGDY
jgi:hypothetical protein